MVNAYNRNGLKHHMPGRCGQLSRASRTPSVAAVRAAVWGSPRERGTVNTSCVLAAFLRGASVLSRSATIPHAVMGAVIAAAQAAAGMGRG